MEPWWKDFRVVCFRFVPMLVISIFFWIGVFDAVKMLLGLLLEEPTIVRG